MSSKHISINTRKQQATPRGVGVMCQWYAEKAENATIWDMEGNQFIDFAGGIGVLNTGHRHPKVISAVTEQLSKFTHTAYQVVPYESYVSLAEHINERAPINGKAKCAFFSTGAEAVENAIKIARSFTQRHGIITFSNAFHGRSFMTMAMTGKTAPYKSDFGLMPGGVFHARYPSELKGITVDDAIRSIEDIFAEDIAAHDVAAIVLEPVQGEGGFNVVPAEFLKRLRSLCDLHGILLIADEVQSGFARTGKLFAMNHYETKADLITMAKSLGGGFPISGVVGRADVMDAPNPGGLGGTYAGSPIGVAAALAVLDVIESEDLCNRANVLGAELVALLNTIKATTHMITDIRALGSMIAVELETAEQAKIIQSYAMENGLLILTCGRHGNAIRFLYPLTIPATQFSQALNILKQGFANLIAS
ncbi:MULTISPECIES: 4-aminobutyrate--2-oxoglutarate transaminase [Acinetobacter]|jgi:4-aminobutyrate aminotransferase|uniref:4-aminobutyrate--2-oxoglutarate transaminase n=1 Tax=Acinetobacter bereziniae TaxID=106648 RepID=A0A8B5RZV8_ACIBZ|nr:MULTISPECIES: 4-aminobutyrate--2-oxoglutarate transaminase [Acinetobacter]MBI0394127.1 4-aminobutyrate--2-oxoglutarate transaminase [Acinetobacter bereziniae]MBJ8420324.1 4-aminobutyrate--2-oxoglutarate transaminase [Acinetobacter bereziniae]MBJ9947972.1 4-aminobutyrate--2-oxoglutarate transaminase [Acinetobacter bereziniae]MCU4419474.1 4-aminobutyrate--2-oxoglutarate transaminase [Acinetobacter bereziniae]MCU4475656.1 4-aminobutyrate--2-oxoglutarate transaminase [Acinetobacter bereziniae]